MNKYEIVRKIEEFAPPETQENWDASGWIVDKSGDDVKKILFALTITQNTVEQAFKKGCDMIISHHPLFHVPLEYKNINMYCAHTNLDKAIGGTTDALLKAMHLDGKPSGDYVRIVDLGSEMGVEYLKLKMLPISPKLRIVNNDNRKTIQKIGFCAGSGSEFIKDTPCDAFVTGDIKYHTAIETNKVLYDIGHFESESFAPELLKRITEVDMKGLIADETSPFI